MASADERVVPFATYLRDGPGVLYRVIDEISNNQRVDVDSCSAGWCRVWFEEGQGYVAEATLAVPQPARAIVPQTCFENGISGFHGNDKDRFCIGVPKP